METGRIGINTDDPVTRARIGFVIELARRLHQYGAAAPRLEQAIGLVAQRLGFQCEALSTPTSTVLSFSERGGDGLASFTQVLRMSPGDVNLARLCRADEIADRVIDGSLHPRDGLEQLRELGRPLSRRGIYAIVGSYGLAAACVAVLLGTGWPDVIVSGALGLLIGALMIAGIGRPRLAAANEAIAALLATFITIAISAWIVPLAVKSVVLSASIILVPGMTLTNAVRELSSAHLVSGVSRVAGAIATLLKLTFGTVAAAQVCAVLHIGSLPHPWPSMPGWSQWPALLVGAVSFAMLFQAARRDYLLVIGAVVVGYLATHFGGAALGAPFGVFIGGLILAALANLYARIAGRPGALVREPGILLLVPGSVGFRSVSYLFNNEIGMSIANPIDVHRATQAVLTGVDSLARESRNVLLLGTTNYTEMIDDALLSRADVVEHMGRPSADAAYEMLVDSLAELSLAEPIESAALREIAEECVRRQTDARQVRKLVLRALIRGDAELALSPSALTAQHLRLALDQE